jgi:hypothetical protein
MKIEKVRQVHDDGCFVACVAMLLGDTYGKAYCEMFPDRYDGHGDLPVENVPQVLERLGFKPVPSRARRIKNLRRDAVIVIRWRDFPSLSHAAVWNSKKRKTLDPWRRYKRRVYETQIEAIYYVDIAAGRRRWKKRR